MKDAKRVLVALDLTAFDDEVIKYASYFCPLVGAEEVYFLHVDNSFYTPNDFPERLREEFVPMDEGEKAIIEDKVKEAFTGSSANIHVNVLEGEPINVLAHTIETKGIDLVIAGLKEKKEHLSILPYKIARKSTASVLFVPSGVSNSIKNIVLPFDFSSHSKEAIEFCQTVSDKTSGVSTKMLHVYQIPTGYYKTGKSYEEMNVIMLQHKQEGLAETMKAYDGFEHSVEMHPTEKGSVSQQLTSELGEEKPDLLVMGSKGQTNSAAIMLGSMAESVITSYRNSPVLIIKKKGENKSLLQAFFDSL